MMRDVAAILVIVLAAVPPFIHPSGVVASVAAFAGVAGVLGAFLRSVPGVTLGASLILIEYALALWLSSAPVSVLGATGFGLALFLLVQLVDLAHRFDGAGLGASMIGAQLRYWIVISGGAGALAFLVIVVAGPVATVVPRGFSPAIAALGAAIAFLGAVTALRGAPGRRD